MIRKGKSAVALGVLAGLLCFVGGVYAAKNEGAIMQSGNRVGQAVTAAFAESPVAWAQKQGLMASEVDAENGHPSQAEFLKMVMTLYGDVQENPLFPVQKAQSHWAHPIYSAAKSHGLLPCSCVIKPDEPLGVKEAAQFVMYGINEKTEGSLIGLQNVEDWAERDSVAPDAPLTYREAAMLLKRMDDYLKAYETKPESGDAK